MHPIEQFRRRIDAMIAEAEQCIVDVESYNDNRKPETPIDAERFRVHLLYLRKARQALDAGDLHEASRMLSANVNGGEG